MRGKSVLTYLLRSYEDNRARLFFFSRGAQSTQDRRQRAQVVRMEMQMLIREKEKDFHHGGGQT